MDAKTPRRLLRNDLDQFRLRTYLEGLIGTDEVEVVEGRQILPMSRRCCTAIRKRYGSRSRATASIESGRQRRRQPQPPRARLRRRARQAARRKSSAASSSSPNSSNYAQNEAPVQEIVLTGTDADLTRLPAHLQHAYDGAPYISASIDYCVDPRTGITNSGMRRIMLRGPHEAGIDLNAPSDLRAIYQAAVARGEKLPISFVVGAHPIDTLSATMRIPVDELGLVGSLRGGTLPVVKCRTNDIRVPADAELVIEGYLDEHGLFRKGRSLRRISRLLRRRKAKSDISRHRDYPSQGCRIPDRDDQRRSHGHDRHIKS